MHKKHMFVVGRRTRRATTLVVLRIPFRPIPGPWTVSAVVSPN